MKKIIKTFGILFLLIVPFTIQAQSDAQLKSIFVYNFIKYIQWPAAYTSGDFVIGVLGSGAISDELGKIAASKKAGTQTIVLKNFSTVSSITQCHLLYITEGKSVDLAAALGKLSGFNTLIISEKAGLAKAGAGINFIVQDSKLRYELNKGNISSKGLQMNNDLAKLAILVD